MPGLQSYRVLDEGPVHRDPLVRSLPKRMPQHFPSNPESCQTIFFSPRQTQKFMCKGETQPCGTEKKNGNEWNFNKTRLPNPQHSTVHATVCQNSGSDSFCPHNHTGSRVQTALPHTRNQGLPKQNRSSSRLLYIILIRRRDGGTVALVEF